MPGEELQATVPDLEEGKDYEFRVIPVNEAGNGEPSTATNPLKLKSRRGECNSHQTSETQV